MDLSGRLDVAVTAFPSCQHVLQATPSPEHHLPEALSGARNPRDWPHLVVRILLHRGERSPGRLRVEAMRLGQDQQTAVTALPPHFINSPAISPGYLDFDLCSGSKVLSLCPNKQPQPGLASSCLAAPWAPPPQPRGSFSP